MRTGEYLAAGAGHGVYVDAEDPGRVVKVPHPGHAKRFGIDRMRSDLEVSERHFSEWLPDTSVTADAEHGYIVSQEKIEHIKHLTPALVASTRENMGQLLEANRRALRDTGTGIDFLGLEGSAKCVLHWARQTPLVRPFMKPMLQAAVRKKDAHPIAAFAPRALELWEKEDPQPEITNVVLGIRKGMTDLQLLLIDLSLVRYGEPSLSLRGRTWVLQHWNRVWMKKLFDLDT